MKQLRVETDTNSSEMKKRRIIALLKDHPEGMTPKVIRPNWINVIRLSRFCQNRMHRKKKVRGCSVVEKTHTV